MPCTPRTRFQTHDASALTRFLLARVRAWLGLGVCVLMLATSSALRAETVTLDGLDLTRNEEGLLLSFVARFQLAPAVEDALQKGVPLYFEAQVEVFRDRWYWRDKRVSSVTRTWRLAYQPLTRKYRVTFGGLSQHYDNLSDALVAVSRTANWKLAEPSQLDDGRVYVEFSYQLDTTQMPRPMQIGIGGQSDWSLKVERVRRLN